MSSRSCSPSCSSCCSESSSSAPLGRSSTSFPVASRKRRIRATSTLSCRIGSSYSPRDSSCSQVRYCCCWRGSISRLPWSSGSDGGQWLRRAGPFESDWRRPPREASKNTSTPSWRASLRCGERDRQLAQVYTERDGRGSTSSRCEGSLRPSSPLSILPRMAVDRVVSIEDARRGKSGMTSTEQCPNDRETLERAIDGDRRAIEAAREHRARQKVLARRAQRSVLLLRQVLRRAYGG